VAKQLDKIDRQPDEAPKNVALLPISRVVFKTLFRFLGGIRVTGSSRIPISGAAILCSNHLSDFDPLAILTAVARNDFNALAKSELFEIPGLGAYLRAVGALTVTRDSADRAALRATEEILEAGRLMLIFPEGRCSPSGKLQKVQSGAMLLSLKTGAPIVPIGLRGTNKVLPYGRLWPRFAGGGVTVTVGDPLLPANYLHLPHKEALRQLNKDVAEAIARLTYQS
jgi:1-acyl-sn-glycerol-3-phosphate acyltransferase